MRSILGGIPALILKSKTPDICYSETHFLPLPLCPYTLTAFKPVKVPGSQQATRIRHCNIEEIELQGLLLSFTTSELPLLGPAENAKILRQTNKLSNVFPACLGFFPLQLLLSFWGPNCTCSSSNFQSHIKIWLYLTGSESGDHLYAE